MAALADHHRLAPLVWRHVSTDPPPDGVPPHVLDALEGAYLAATARAASECAGRAPGPGLGLPGQPYGGEDGVASASLVRLYARRVARGARLAAPYVVRPRRLVTDVRLLRWVRSAGVVPMG